MIPQQIINDAEKYKKIFEKYTINPNYLHLNANDFYLVFYQRFSKDTEMILVTPSTDVPIEEYNKAFELLVFLLNNASSIKSNGTERKNINMQAYEKTKTFLFDVLENIYLNQPLKQSFTHCKDNISNTLELQNECIELVNNYESFMNKKRDQDENRFFPADVDYIQTTLAELDYIQYKQLLNELNTCDDFSHIYQELNTNEQLKNYATSEIKRYIKEYSSSKKRLEQEISKITYFNNQGDFTREEHIQEFKNSYKDLQRDKLQNLKKEVRNFN